MICLTSSMTFIVKYTFLCLVLINQLLNYSTVLNSDRLACPNSKKQFLVHNSEIVFPLVRPTETITKTITLKLKVESEWFFQLHMFIQIYDVSDAENVGSTSSCGCPSSAFNCNVRFLLWQKNNKIIKIFFQI